MLKLINAHNLFLSKKAILAFWQNNFKQIITINGSDYESIQDECICAEYFKSLKNRNVFYAIDDESQAIIGLGKINIEDHVGTIMFSVAEEYREKGFGYEICDLLINKGFKKGLSEICLVFSDYNIPMEIIAQKNGFHFIGYSEVGQKCDSYGYLNYSLKRPKK